MAIKSKKRKKSSLQSLGDLLGKYDKPVENKYVSREFQDFGYRMAMELSDEKHKALYIKMAKTEDRALIESALRFVKDSGAKKPGALFMWKLKKLKEEAREKSDTRK